MHEHEAWKQVSQLLENQDPAPERLQRINFSFIGHRKTSLPQLIPHSQQYFNNQLTALLVLLVFLLLVLPFPTYFA